MLWVERGREKERAEKETIDYALTNPPATYHRRILP